MRRVHQASRVIGLLVSAAVVATMALPAVAAVSATVCLYDSTGVGISGAQAHYRSGGSWILIGT
ncbi:MAG: hypothetical protein L0Z47_04200, partial [Actinobacteria bacterium]|nr:hypothetical protein [Actinomycetota bacterium]